MSDHHPHSRAGLYDRLDEANEAIHRMCQRYAELVADRDEWKQQHENLLAVRQQDAAALTATIERLERELAKARRDLGWAELGDELGADFGKHIDAAMKGASDVDQ